MWRACGWLSKKLFPPRLRLPVGRRRSAYRVRTSRPHVEVLEARTLLTGFAIHYTPIAVSRNAPPPVALAAADVNGDGIQDILSGGGDEGVPGGTYTVAWHQI